MKLGEQSVRSVLVSGALLGASAWTTLAAIEYAIGSLLPRFQSSPCTSASGSWNAGLGVLALYPLAGAALGALTAIVCRLLADRWPRMWEADAEALLGALSTLSVALAIGAGVAVQFELRGVSRAMYLASLVVAGGLGLAAWSTVMGSRTSVLASPWIASALLLGAPRLAASGWFIDERLPIYGLALAYGAALSIPWMLQITGRGPGNEISPRPEQRRAMSPLKRALASFAAAAGILTAAFGLDTSAYLYAPRSTSAPPSETRPNIILIVLDTARAQSLSIAGYERDTTPHLADIARGATVYGRAISASNYTLSSHASLFTGLFPTSHGAHPDDPSRPTGPVGGFGLADRFETIAETLSGQGYFTGAVVANYGFVTEGYNLNQGFHRFAVRSYRCAPPSPAPLFQKLWDVWSDGSHRSQRAPYHDASQINQDVIGLIDKLARRNQRFFLFVNYMDAHWPYSPPPPFDARFAGRDPGFDRRQYFDLRNAVLGGTRRVTEGERRHLISQYDGALAFLDQEIGRLAGWLKSKRLYDEALVIVTSDHGEAFGEKGFVEHGTSVYQDQVHVPLLVKYPRQEKGANIPAAVSTVDVVPTILDVLRLPISPLIQGRSLRPMDGPRTVISESFPRSVFRHLGPRFQRVQRAFFEGPFKLVVSPGSQPELYDLNADPSEKVNRFRADDQRAVALLGRLDSWLAAAAHERGMPVGDPESLERLRSLGYIR